MEKNTQLGKLFTNLYNGSPWLGVNLVETLSQISAEKAAKKIHPDRNSIWEITNHLISWRLNVLERVRGKSMVTPGHNYILPIGDASENAWKNTLKQLENSQHQWLDFLKTCDEKDFKKIYANNQMTYYEHIHGILQHDAYHLGQIVILVKMV